MGSLENPISQAALQNVRRARSHVHDPVLLGTRGFRGALDHCLQTVAQGVAAENDRGDLQATRTALDELAELVRTQGYVAATRDYDAFLYFLTGLYADVCERRDEQAPATTAAGYAAVIEAISRRHPGFDYTDPLGQLLELMTRLFRARNKDWKVVYEHLRAIPDSIPAKQTLKRVCAADIHEWFDAGVQNLFSLQSDLAAKLRELGEHARDIDDEIAEKEDALAALRRRLDPHGRGKVIILQGRALEREITSLRFEKQDLLDEVDGRESTLGLIESDIAEFEGILREARRAYYLRIVQSEGTPVIHAP